MPKSKTKHWTSYSWWFRARDGGGKWQGYAGPPPKGTAWPVNSVADAMRCIAKWDPEARYEWKVMQHEHHETTTEVKRI